MPDVKNVRIKNGVRIIEPFEILDEGPEAEPTLLIPTEPEKLLLNAIDSLLERYHKSKYTQGHWINLDRKIAVIPIMRSASSSMNEIMSKVPNWKKFHNKECSKDFQFFTVWRDPYVRFISALSRELSEICDPHKGNEKEIIQKTVTAWLDNPDLILTLDHTISQTEYCRQVVPKHSTVTVYNITELNTMLADSAGVSSVIPHLNPSSDYQPDIKRFFDTEKNFMQKWCEQEYKEDYNTWDQLTNADTLSINIAY